jgi:hypothetical protein
MESDVRQFNINCINYFFTDIKRSQQSYCDDLYYRLYEMHRDAIEIIKHFPSLKIEEKLDSLIFDTKPYVKNFKMPFDAFFIDKEFEVDIGIIKGIYVYDNFKIKKRIYKITKNKYLLENINGSSLLHVGSLKSNFPIFR